VLRLAAMLAVQERFVYEVAQAGIQVNLIFMALNLLPIPPLDGGRIVSGLLPTRMSIAYSRIEPFGLIILLVLMFTHLLSPLLRPLQEFGAAVVGIFL
jgi:Zn-dependent protease